MRKKDYEKAAEKYQEIYNYSGSYSALVGYSQAVREVGKYDDAILKIETELEKFEGTSAFYYLEFVLADLYSLSSDSINADKYYSILIEQNPHEIYRRNAVVNRLLLNKGIEEISRYLKNRSERYAIIKGFLDQNPNSYIIVQMIYLAENDDVWNVISDHIENSNTIIEYPSDLYFALSNYCYRRLDFDRALTFAKRALKESNFSVRSIILQHIDKLEWILKN
jgi:tetratricopeptide (TPR) repeat protein